MSVATFDTLKFANTLKAAGVPEKQAEAQAVAFAEVIQINFKDQATKGDLAATAKDVRQELKDVEQRLTARINDVEQSLTTKIKDVEQGLTAKIKDSEQGLTARIKDVEQGLTAKIDGSIAEVKVQIAQVKGELVLVRWMLGVLVGGVVAVLIRLFLFRGPV